MNITFSNTSPAIQNQIFADRVLYYLDYLHTGGPRPTAEDLIPVADPAQASLASSRCKGTDLHMPCFDLDFPTGAIQVIPSASGFSHLYINVPMTWDKACILLDAFEKVGLVQPGYAKASKEQGMLRLRMPGVPKLNLPHCSSEPAPVTPAVQGAAT